MNVIIRPMRRSDAAAVVNMLCELMAFHGDKMVVAAKDFLTYSVGSKKLAHVWVALTHNKPVGFAITYDWMNFVRGKVTRTIDLLYVKQEMRRSGVGRALMIAVAESALSHGCNRLSVSAVEGNEAANRFYDKLGLKPRTKRTVKYNADGQALKRLAKTKKR